MELVSFTASNFRSITSAQGIRLARQTILVGPNNEGKSNLLLALVTAMRLIEQGQHFFTNLSPDMLARILFEGGQTYSWDRDFPKHLQTLARTGTTTLQLEFELDSKEIREFQKVVGSSLNGSLPVELRLGAGTAAFRVKKQGPGAKKLTKKAGRIAKFVSEHIRLEHIPAVRTASQAEAVVASMVERELRLVEQDPAFQSAVKQIRGLQQPVLDRLSASIRDTLVAFLPSVRAVSLEVPQEERLGILRKRNVMVDDGTKTMLQQKGDGAQSLAALGVMRYQTERDAAGRSLVIAIEEPESHLHPDAIHRLREVIAELAGRHQVVITTHCPVFVDRLNVGANIIVRNRVAKPAKSIDAIRKALGVRASDNLRHADLVLLVEGECDRVALTALFRHESQTLREALTHGTLAITGMGGGSKLSFFAAVTRSALCNVHGFLDKDQEGDAAAAKARDEAVLAAREITQATCPGLRESELEDLYDGSQFDDILTGAYNS